MSTETPLSGNGQPPESAPPSAEPVWTFRGYQMRPAEFNTAMVHFYRGEVQRSNTWRLRLDNTTNWAVIAAGAAISFTLSDPAHHYGVIILDTLL
ncbi:MAG: Integral rane protein-like (modular protein), partial [Anaerolineales bacterium]|nr:Integral rane protein-like (modular protein) [Anaerolineales bacterium]